eukprot:3462275-Alexandrium_andersonii.AAC.1
MTGAHLALRGVPKILTTADPGLRGMAAALGAPMMGDVDSRPAQLTLRAISAPSRRADRDAR